MKYLSLRPDLINNIFRHINKKAICDILSRIMSSRLIESNTRNEIIIKILDLMNSENQETIFSISGLMEDVLQNLNFIDSLLVNLSIFEKMHIILINIDSASLNYKEILRVFIKLYEIFTETLKYKSFDFKPHHFDNIEKLTLKIKDNFLTNSESNLPTAFNASINTLGLKK